MKKVVIFTEKPAMAKSLVQSFETKQENEHYYEILPCDTFPYGAKITWGRHLVELSELLETKLDPNPDTLRRIQSIYQNSNLDKLLKLNEPISIERLNEFFGEYFDENSIKHFHEVIQLFKESDLIVNACDCDSTGDTKFDLMYALSGVRTSTQRTRYYSLLPEEIEKSWKDISTINPNHSVPNNEEFSKVLGFLEKMVY